MASEDYLKLSDPALEKQYSARPIDPAKARSKLAKQVAGKRRAKTKNGVTSFTPGFPVGGKETHFVPEERFPQFLQGLVDSIKEGAHDAYAFVSDKLGGSAPTTTRKPRADAGKPRGPRKAK